MPNMSTRRVKSTMKWGVIRKRGRSMKKRLPFGKRSLGPDHPDVALSLNNLAALYHDEGQYAKAEPLFQRSLKILEKALGPDHPDVAVCLNNLATLYYTQGQYAKAEPLYQRCTENWGKDARSR